MVGHMHICLRFVSQFHKTELLYNYQARYIPFFNVRQYTQINVYFIKEYGIVPIAYGCTKVRSRLRDVVNGVVGMSTKTILLIF